MEGESDLLYTVDEAARRLAVSRRTAYRLMSAGLLAFVRIGRYRRIPAPALAAYVNTLRREGPAA